MSETKGSSSKSIDIEISEDSVPLVVGHEISIKEEEIDQIKKEDVDLDFDTVLVSDVELETKKEIQEFSNDNLLIDPKDIPGIEKIVNIEDILKNNLNSTDSTNLLSSKNKNGKVLPPKNSTVSKNTPIPCNCMQHVKYYCMTCNVVVTRKKDETECPACKTALKLQCSKCKRKYKILITAQQYLLQRSKQMNLLSNEKKGITLKCQKQLIFCCSVCFFKSENKEEFDQHSHQVHNVIKKVKKKQIDYSKDDDEFIEIYCKKCSKTKINDNCEKHVCPECQEVMLYRCTFCKRLYKYLVNLRYHLQGRCRKRIEHFKFHCDHCHFKHEDKSELELHIKLMHTPEMCEHCKKEFPNSRVLKQHKTKGCPTEKYNKKIEMNQLKLQNSTTDSLPSIENSTTSLPSIDSYEILQYDPDELYNEICSRPRKDFNCLSWYSAIDYFCLLCGGHTNKKKFSKFRPWCSTCNVQYEYRCTICQKLYSGYSTICKHAKSECPNRHSIACSMCDFTSIQKKLLINHIKNLHTVLKCLHCESICNGYLSLRKHLKSNCKYAIMLNEKNIQKLIALFCKQCSNRIIYTDDPSLKSCTKCTLIMSFECLKCNQLFNNLELACKHVKYECKIQFDCNKCNYNTYSQYELDNHIKLMHSNRKCPDCGVQFRDEEIFRMHRFEELRQKEEKEKLLSQQETKRIKLS